MQNIMYRRKKSDLDLKGSIASGNLWHGWAVSVEPQVELVATCCYFTRVVSTTLLFQQWTWSLATYRHSKGKLFTLSIGWFNPLFAEKLGSIFRSVFFQKFFDLISSLGGTARWLQLQPSSAWPRRRKRSKRFSLCTTCITARSSWDSSGF